MQKTIIAIGGGEIKNKTTLKIDEYASNLAKARAGEVRATALFIGTASHDSMPYFNSFRKTYTSVFDIKAEVALVVYGEMNAEHIQAKVDKADMLYIGGGDTLFMLEKWQQTGLYQMILNAYNQGKIIVGLSAGAICWFKKMYTDYEIMRGQSADYVIKDGIGLLDGMMSPHYNERVVDFDKAFLESDFPYAYAVENDCAIEFIDGQFSKVISAGGKAYKLTKEEGKLIKTEL